MSRRPMAAAVGLVVLMAPLAHGVVADAQIMTDHRVYRGELACSTLDGNIANAYRVFKDRYGHTPATDIERLLALWGWTSKHYMHAGGTRVYMGPDNPDANRTDAHLPWAGSNGWMESGQTKQVSHSIIAGKQSDTWTINTGDKVATTRVRLEAE